MQGVSARVAGRDEAAALSMTLGMPADPPWQQRSEGAAPTSSPRMADMPLRSLESSQLTPERED